MKEFQNFVNVFYDAEFTGLHKDTTPISIAFATCNPTLYFYAEFNDYEESQVTEWIKDNVIEHLKFNGFENCCMETPSTEYDQVSVSMKGSRESVAQRLMKWFNSLTKLAPGGGTKIRFFTDCYAYDWVVLNDLICPDGDALKLPDNLYYIPTDLSTALHLAGVDPDISREEFIGEESVRDLQITLGALAIKHNCLWDAFVCYQCFIKCLKMMNLILDPSWDDWDGDSDVIFHAPR